MRLVSLTLGGVIASLTLLDLAAADFHLMSSFVANGGDYEYYSLIYVPSNKYNCNWIEHGSPGVVDGDTWPASFTSKNPVCGVRQLQFRERNGGGYDLYNTEDDENGTYVGWCASNKTGRFPYDIDCSVLPFYTSGATEFYVCYSYICNS